MQMHVRWSEAGEPVLTSAEKKAMGDFWAAYEEGYDEIQRQLIASIGELPDLAAVIKRMSPEELAREGQRSRELMRRALTENVWGPLVEHNRVQGETYAAFGVRFREWFELVGEFQRLLLPGLIRRFGGDTERFVSTVAAMNRYVDITMSVIAEAYLQSKEKLIAQQQQEIQELSTPVLQMRDRLLLLPVVGLIDTQRARLITQHLLQSIRATRAKVVVIDITGVPAVDSKVANHLLQTVAAARLMGATAVVTGLSAEVAQALVTLGVDLSAMNTIGDLQGGLEEADRLLGVRVVEVEDFRPVRNGVAGARREA